MNTLAPKVNHVKVISTAGKCVVCSQELGKCPASGQIFEGFFLALCLDENDKITTWSKAKQYLRLTNTSSKETIENLKVMGRGYSLRINNVQDGYNYSTFTI